jgi:hypothetical protein
MVMKGFLGYGATAQPRKYKRAALEPVTAPPAAIMLPCLHLLLPSVFAGVVSSNGAPRAGRPCTCIPLND